MDTDKNSIKVYFLGSGTIAIAPLLALIADERIEICGIGSQPDRPAGRKKKLQATPLAAAAETAGFEVDKPASVNDSDFLDKLESIAPDFIVVIAYGQLLRERVLNLPRTACLNVHASLLPAYRGASPLQSAILNGDKNSGVCFMLMEKGLDSGPVFSTYEFPLPDDITSDRLETALSDLAAQKLAGDLIAISKKDLTAVAQDHSRSSHCAKISKQAGLIDWNDPADLIERKVRAYTPWPGVKASFDSERGLRRVTLNKVTPLPGKCENASGSILSADGELIIACGEGSRLKIDRLTPEGKREMDTKSFLAGSPLRVSPAESAQ